MVTAPKHVGSYALDVKSIIDTRETRGVTDRAHGDLCDLILRHAGWDQEAHVGQDRLYLVATVRREIELARVALGARRVPTADLLYNAQPEE
jgi:hypothetical protein